MPPRSAARNGWRRTSCLKRADVISIHSVLSPRTSGLVGEREFALMKPTAFLINTSRGPIVDEAALLAALRSNRIGSYGADTYDVEPLPRARSCAPSRALAHPLHRLT